MLSVRVSTVQLISQFLRCFEELKEGFSADPAGRNEALKALLDDIIAAPWATTEERTLAQHLVVRLERLRR